MAYNLASFQKTSATSNGFSRGKHFESARIRAFVTTQTEKTFSNESNADYYFIIRITENNGKITVEKIGGFCQHSALVAREEKSASQKAGREEGEKMAAQSCYAWALFSSQKEENETAKEKTARLSAAHDARVREIEESLNAALCVEKENEEKAPPKKAPRRAKK